MSYHRDSNSDGESDDHERDPGREVIEKNIRNRLQRIADQTKDELNKVLKRVDNTLNSYEYSVQASLVQHGMSTNEMSNVEHVADIKELEELLNDSLAKQRYKQRLMIFIVGQTEQVTEKSKLLQQVGQFFQDQKQNFSGNEFQTFDDTPDGQDEVDLQLKSFDVKDCYVHVTALGTRLSQLNEEIMQYLIQNAGNKQQAKGKKKLAQVAKETKEQLANLQSKLEMANTEMINRDNKIESLENDIETLKNEAKTTEEKLHEYESEIESYKNQIEDLKKSAQPLDNEETPVIIESEPVLESNDVEEQVNPEDIQIITPPAIQPSENLDDLSSLLNSADQIDVDNISIENFQQLVMKRIRELLKELETKESNHNQLVESLQDEFFEYRKLCEREGEELIQKAEDAYALQIKAQTAAEQAIKHLQEYMAEQDRLKQELVHREMQTDTIEEIPSIPTPEEIEPVPPPEIAIQEEIEPVPPPEIATQEEIEPTPSPERITPEEILYPTPEDIHPTPLPEDVSTTTTTAEQFTSTSSKVPSEEIESAENFRGAALKDKYASLIEGKRQELDQLKLQADSILSRPTSIRDRLSLQSLEASLVSAKQRASVSSFCSAEFKENIPESEAIFKQDQEQQTSLVNSRRSSQQMTIESDSYKSPFFHLYESIYKFRQTIINLLEQNQFESLASCLQLTKQLSSDNDQPSDFLTNIERVLKDLTKILQTCLKTFQSKIIEYENKSKEKEVIKPITPEPIVVDDHQSRIIQEKDLIIHELNTKYDRMTNILNQTNVKHENEIKQSENLIHNQQKIIQNLQQQLVHLQKRLNKIENEGIVEPSILFTRLDAERNEKTLQQAVSKGSMLETIYHELNDVMNDYVSLPCQQLRNLVRRYIQFRKVADIESRIQREMLDGKTKTVLQKMETLYERRSNQMSKQMLKLRQERMDLARNLTEKFDHLEQESSIFLIRPIYSYQGRAATQTYMENEKHHREILLNQNANKRRHHPSRQSTHTQSEYAQQMPNPFSSFNSSDEDDRLFRIDKTLPSPSSTEQSSHPNTSRQQTRRYTGLTRIQEIDIQRALLPVSHTNTPLLASFNNNIVDPCMPSLNLRSYIALQRPGVDLWRTEKSNENVHPVSRERFSSYSGKSRPSNPHTPHNSSAGDLRRTGAPLPPIKRSIPTCISPETNERPIANYTVNNNEISAAD